MKPVTTFSSILACGFFTSVSAVYSPLREYKGPDFFSGWDFTGNIDNTTWGNVTFVDQATAASASLAYVNEQGNAIIRVDNTTNIAPATLVNRNTVKITTTDAYPLGSLIVIDLVHLPYGCSVWPSFWTLGTDIIWPHGGEIDIIEGINLMTNNQMALHADPGCVQAPNPAQSGKTLNTDCAPSDDRGCIVAETKPNSYGKAFADAGGGVFALQFDVAGAWIWFWSRPDIPQSIQSANSTSNMDTTDWGLPSAAYPANTCNLTQFFTPQSLILDITLCGDWAGIPSLYNNTCSGNCIQDNIFGTGNPVYDTAYFEVSYVRTWTTGDPPVSSASAPSASTPVGSGEGATATEVVTSTGVLSAPSAGSGSSSAAGRVRVGGAAGVGGVAGVCGLLMLTLWTCLMLSLC